MPSLTHDLDGADHGGPEPPARRPNRPRIRAPPRRLPVPPGSRRGGARMRGRVGRRAGGSGPPWSAPSRSWVRLGIVHQELALAIAVIIAGGVCAQWGAAWLRIPSVLLLLPFGVLAGPVTGIVQPTELFGDALFPLTAIAIRGKRASPKS